jgi:hypothetical protein
MHVDILGILSLVVSVLGLLLNQEVREWIALRSESSARKRLAYLRGEYANPPTLIGSIAPIICLMPLPVALWTGMIGASFTGLIWPPPNLGVPPSLARGLFAFVMFVAYFVSAISAAIGIRVAYRLRHGEHQYAKTYRASIQKQIDDLVFKYPKLSPGLLHH